MSTRASVDRIPYEDTYHRFMTLENGLEDTNGRSFQDKLHQTIAFFHQAMHQRQQEALLSDNESFFELQNDQLYAFCLEYYLGMLIPKQTFLPSTDNEEEHENPSNKTKDGSRSDAQSKQHERNLMLRVRFLQEADVYYTQFLDRCEKMGILAEKKRREQYERMENKKFSLSREEKIGRFQMQRELEKKLEIIRQRKTTDKDNDEEDDVEREQLMAFIQLAVVKSMEEQSSVNQEKEMLETMLKMNAMSVKKDLFTDAHRAPKPPQGQGITVTHINPQFEMRRETIRSSVFQPGHRLPTMSLEEYADQQLADAKERQQREQEASTGPRRYDQLVEDGDEDDEQVVEEATYKDRAWDDWKDANPRGIGNKKGSQF